VAKTEAVDERTLAVFAEALGSDEPMIRSGAVRAVARQPGLEPEIIVRLSNMLTTSDPDQGEQILQVFSKLGPDAELIIPQLARIVANRQPVTLLEAAKAAIVKLKQHAKSAVPILVQGDLTIDILECLAEIGPSAAEAVPKIEDLLRTFDAESSQLGERQLWIAAAVAKWKITGDTDIASSVLREQLDGPARASALAKLREFARFDPSFIPEIARLVPDLEAIATLRHLRVDDPSVTEPLENAARSNDLDVAFAATQALWETSGNVQPAIQLVESALERAKYKLPPMDEIELDRISRAVSFLLQQRDPVVANVLDQLRLSRFAELRKIARDHAVSSTN
jgi:hypothetical protein